MGRPKGSLHTEESRLKISMSMKGHAVAPETREKLRKAAERKRLGRLKKALRQGKYNWSEKGKSARTRYNQSPKGRAALLAAKARYRARKRLEPKEPTLTKEQELALLIAEQERDAKIFQIKHGPEFGDYAPVVRHW